MSASNSDSFLSNFGNWLIVQLLKLISYLPFFVLYFFSDLLFLLINYVIKYRYKVIIINLKNSFPQKSEKEIKQIARKFYRHFCDILVESIKVYSISEKQLEKRMKFKNLELLDRYYNQGKSVVIVGMHYNNWEWCTYLPGKIKHTLYAVYSPVKNQAVENFLLKYRTRFNPIMVPMNKSSRMVIDFVRAKTPHAVWLLSDQSPSPNTKSWVKFLNQETAFFSGPEKIAHRSKQPIVFEHVKKVGRGKYEVFHYPLIEDYTNVDTSDILIAFTRKMEEIISENPENYLWSHRRWKHKRPGNISLIGK